MSTTYNELERELNEISQMEDEWARELLQLREGIWFFRLHLNVDPWPLFPSRLTLTSNLSANFCNDLLGSAIHDAVDGPHTLACLYVGLPRLGQQKPTMAISTTNLSAGMYICLPRKLKGRQNLSCRLRPRGHPIYPEPTRG